MLRDKTMPSIPVFGHELSVLWLNTREVHSTLGLMCTRYQGGHQKVYTDNATTRVHDIVDAWDMVKSHETVHNTQNLQLSNIENSCVYSLYNASDTIHYNDGILSNSNTLIWTHIVQAPARHVCPARMRR